MTSIVSTATHDCNRVETNNRIDKGEAELTKLLRAEASSISMMKVQTSRKSL